MSVDLIRHCQPLSGGMALDYRPEHVIATSELPLPRITQGVSELVQHAQGRQLAGQQARDRGCVVTVKAIEKRKVARRAGQSCRWFMFRVLAIGNERVLRLTGVLSFAHPMVHLKPCPVHGFLYALGGFQLLFRKCEGICPDVVEVRGWIVIGGLLGNASMGHAPA